MAGIIGGAAAIVISVTIFGLVAWIVRRRYSQCSGPGNSTKPTLTSHEENNNSKPEMASMSEQPSVPNHASHESPSGPPNAEHGYESEPDIEISPSSTPVAGKSAS
jgi:hypothetical protein